ncbi:MAG: sodium:hydrogen antiporter [Porticoccaceae bacterium]|nr:MAG: sodium:hydrogen antiporter [Porticoccaceae bacterium]
MAVGEGIFTSFFYIFTGAAAAATCAMFGRQPLLVAYIALGVLFGPHGLGLIQDVAPMADIATVGIIFLLFLLGLDMQPQALAAVFREAAPVTLASSLLFGLLGYLAALPFGFGHLESLVVGAAMMFSSTIIGIKLLPTTVLHHRHAGELMVGLLLMQDFIAIFVLMLLLAGEGGSVDLWRIARTLVAAPLLVGFCALAVRFALLPLFARFDRVSEYVFLLAIGWCLGVSELAALLGLSHEIGAFLAGITIATSPFAQYIALSLKPLRDFFLILFFFSIGARFDLALLPQVLAPALLLGVGMLLVKPVTFYLLLRKQSEHRRLAWDLGFRLGQISEFSLLIAFVAEANGLIGAAASLLIQAATLLTFLVSSYIVVFNFPNPIAPSERLRRD